MQVFEEAFAASSEVMAGLKGRAADDGASLPWVASMAAAAGNGDHIEIGTLFGASAIAVALTKKRLGLAGKICCVDPFGPRSNVEIPSTKVPTELHCGNAEAVLENAAKFGVELELIQKASMPWPEELGNRMFVSAYIDGNHQQDMPWQDFLNLHERVEKYIGFDNYEEGYPDVVKAVHRAILGRECWFLYFKQSIFVALRRRMGARQPGMPLDI